MLVKEILTQKTRDLITVEPQTTLKDAMKLLIDHKISCLLVTAEPKKLVGIISDKDIFKAVYENMSVIETETVEKFMETDVIVGLAEDNVNYIAGLMTINKVRHIPVIEGKDLVGLVSVGDVVKSHMTDIQVENRYLKIYISGDYPA